ncbi:C-C motif chemokine 27a [Parambassis ranga]|uniref:C-C motif chemokine 27a n=1 Tax=Parambassis ranga TaxID=210632 RepID=A0A6P7J0L9_9TELE|nr:C-C motif chemokine 25-like [Parambassis ranga]
MDVKVALVIVSLCALAITSTEGGIPKCCITAKAKIPIQILQRVHDWEYQDSSGACDIKALKLYLRMFKKPICADPKYLKMLLKMKLKRRQ